MKRCASASLASLTWRIGILGLSSLLVAVGGVSAAWANRGGQLVVADPVAEKLYVYRVPDLELVAEFNEIRMATHPGFLPLKGDRILFIHEEPSEHEHDDDGDENGDHGHDHDDGEDNGHSHNDEGEDHGHEHDDDTARHDHEEDGEDHGHEHADHDHEHAAGKAQHDHDDDGHDHGENGDDEAGGELIVLHMNLKGKPTIIGRAPVGAPASHIAVHPHMTYAVASASDPEHALSIVDLRWWSTALYDTVASIPLATVDPGVAFGKNPAVVYHRFIDPSFTAGRLEAYPLTLLLAGESEPTGVVELGGSPHGELISHRLKVLCSATDRGIECADIVGKDLAPRGILPYDASGRSSGRAFFVRLANDQRFFYSYLRDASSGPTWPEWQNDAYIGNLATGAVRRVPLGPGILFRFALSDSYALYATLHPNGDLAHLLDTNPKSPTFGQVVARIPLDPLLNPPDPAVSPFAPGQETRLTAITPDGRWGFVTHGGDGLISVIDTQARQVVRKLQVPTALTGGGYLVAVQSGMKLGDTIGR